MDNEDVPVIMLAIFLINSFGVIVAMLTITHFLSANYLTMTLLIILMAVLSDMKGVMKRMLN